MMTICKQNSMVDSDLLKVGPDIVHLPKMQSDWIHSSVGGFSGLDHFGGEWIKIIVLNNGIGSKFQVPIWQALKLSRGDCTHVCQFNYARNHSAVQWSLSLSLMFHRHAGLDITRREKNKGTWSMKEREEHFWLELWLCQSRENIENALSIQAF